MASRKQNKKEVPTGTTTVVDPFASTVEPVASLATTGTPRPTRTVAKPAAKKTIDSNAVEGRRPPARKPADKKEKDVPQVTVADAFSEIAGDTPGISSQRSEPKMRKPTAAKKAKVVAQQAKGGSAAPEAAAKPKRAKSSRKKKVAPSPPTSPVAASSAAVLERDNAQSTTAERAVELSPVFKKLADVKLPQLDRENRARLLMQSPTRLYLYWSIRSNPWQQLKAVFGPDLGSYSLVLKLRNMTAGTEQVHLAEPEGEWWFNEVEPAAEYMAEIGFYAPNRPYFRVIFSNTITTPRRSPSPHPATEARWTVSATKFAEVLDASGFSRDAVDVAIAGDDHLSADHRARIAFAELTGRDAAAEHSAEDIRHAMISLAGGVDIDALRSSVSSSIIDTLTAAGSITADQVRSVLSSHFDIDEQEWEEYEYGSAVFGASLVNFPKTLKARRDVKYSPRYNPVSSFSLGR